MSEAEQQIIVGRIGAVYGVKGWLKIISFTDDAESIFSYQPWQLLDKQSTQTLNVTDWRRHNKGLIAKFDGVDNRDAAQLLTNLDIAVTADTLPELPEDEYYWRDLIGAQVVNLSGYHLGQVIDLMETGSNDVLVVKANASDAFGKKERLIPFIDEQVIKQIDLQARQIEVDWDPGF
jgi:16S rRNA processing protein RimM